MAKIEGLGELPQSNMFDELPDFTRVIHNRENNQKSQGILDEGSCPVFLLSYGHLRDWPPGQKNKGFEG